eukprot:2779612-Rhodomonas_salina.1
MCEVSAERERERQTDRQRDRQTERETIDMSEADARYRARLQYESMGGTELIDVQYRDLDYGASQWAVLTYAVRDPRW